MHDSEWPEGLTEGERIELEPGDPENELRESALTDIVTAGAASVSAAAAVYGARGRSQPTSQPPEDESPEVILPDGVEHPDRDED